MDCDIFFFVNKLNIITLLILSRAWYLLAKCLLLALQKIGNYMYFASNYQATVKQLLDQEFFKHLTELV